MKTRNCLVIHAVLYWVIWNQNIHQSEPLHVSGKLRSSVTLPCSYDVLYDGLIPTCWGRGACSLMDCAQPLLETDGTVVAYHYRSKYKLYGDIKRGNMSLTIHDLNLEDVGQYCCRIKYRGLFNDQKDLITLTVLTDERDKCLSDNNSVNSLQECESESQQNATTDVTFCNFINYTTYFNWQVCNSSKADFSEQKIIDFSQNLLANLTASRGTENSERQKAFTHFLEDIKSTVIVPALGLRKNMRITSPALALLAFISYSDLEAILDTTLLEEESKSSRKLLTSQFNSKIVTVTQGNAKTHKLNGTVNITLQGKEGGVAGGKKVCAFWKATTKGGYWSTAGCRLTAGNDTHTECSCSHLSSFAVLLALYDITNPIHLSILSWITCLGLPVSLLCLLLAMGTFFCCASIQNLNTTIRAHLCLSLFLAEVVFLVAMSIDTDMVFCAILAGCMHYLFLAAFAWMSLEATQLCLMVLNLKVVNFSRTRIIPRWLMYTAGYGCPAAIVAVSAAVNHEGYGTDTHCWLNLEKGFLWSFLGPLCFVILVNTILLSITLWILRDKIASLNADVSTIKESRMLTVKAVAQFILLGCSWVFGLFQMNEDTLVFSYLFTIFNVLQGLFIFCIHCVLNNQVRREYRKWLIKTFRPKKAEMAETSSSMLNSSKITVQKTIDEPISKPEVFWMNSDTREMPLNGQINH
uniref:adhesion G protein-coupled receptor E3-like isoform X2 n=1 Tax=Pristiophorus japonicus TaxID=55135 RepID=UPI00398E7EBA